MKFQKITKSLMLLMMAFALMTINSCEDLFSSDDKDDNGNNNGITYTLKQSNITTSIALKITDAATGKVIGADSKSLIELNYEGAGVSRLVDISGSSSLPAELDMGVFALGVHKDDKPTAGSPVQFTILVHVDGYLTSSVFIALYETGEHYKEIRLVDPTNPPDGVSVEMNTDYTLGEGGIVTEDIMVANGMSALNIFQGTTLLGNDGNPLSGQLEIILIHFDNTVPEALMAFPGGLTANIDGQNDPVMFYSGGFISMQITDEQGAEAATFGENTAEISMQMSEETFNPESGGAVQEGDEIPLWSYNENDGNWIQEGVATVTSEKGYFSVTNEITHLSWWNWDWSGDVCYTGMDIIFGAESGQNYLGCLLVNVYEQQTDILIKTGLLCAYNNQAVHLLLVPEGLPVYLEFLPNCNSYFEPTQDYYYIDDLCSSTELMVDLIPIAGTTLADIDVNIQAVCPDNDNATILPSGYLFFYKSGNPCWRWVYFYQGSATFVNMELGATYGTYIYYDGIIYSYQYTFESGDEINETIELSGSLCSDVFGL